MARPRYELADYLDLTPSVARAQWSQVRARVQQQRQEQFTPVEAVLCACLFFVLDPHHYGGGSMSRAPEVVKQLGRLFARPPGSVLSKMLNLEGSRANAGSNEWEFFLRATSDTGRLVDLYVTAVDAAREVGIGPGELPDFLDVAGRDDIEMELLGQDELADVDIEAELDPLVPERARKLGAGELETMRLMEQSVRLGQHRFASAVLDNYGHACAMCGFAPRSLPGHRLLVASHIKPWRNSGSEERIDPANGIAACPTHDAAFDSGLLTVNGGLRIHRSPRLEASMRVDPQVSDWFGESVGERLLLPESASPPGKDYLDYHRRHIFRSAA